MIYESDEFQEKFFKKSNTEKFVKIINQCNVEN